MNYAYRALTQITRSPRFTSLSASNRASGELGGIQISLLKAKKMTIGLCWLFLQESFLDFINKSRPAMIKTGHTMEQIPGWEIVSTHPPIPLNFTSQASLTV